MRDRYGMQRGCWSMQKGARKGWRIQEACRNFAVACSKMLEHAERGPLSVLPTHEESDEDEAGDESVDGEVGEDFPGEPELGEAGVVEAGEGEGLVRRDVLVHAGHQDHRHRRVDHVEGGNEEVVENVLARGQVRGG